MPEGQDITTWDPTDAVWFRIYADQADLSGSTITWPSDGEFRIASLKHSYPLLSREQQSATLANTDLPAQAKPPST